MKLLSLLLALVPLISYAHPPATFQALSMLFIEEVLGAEEQACSARAPLEGKKLAAALTQWRKQNRGALDQLQGVSADLERKAYGRLLRPATRGDTEAGVSMLLQLSSAKTADAGAILTAFAMFNDTQAQGMCAEYAAQALSDGWLRSEITDAMKVVESLP